MSGAAGDGFMVWLMVMVPLLSTLVMTGPVFGICGLDPRNSSIISDRPSPSESVFGDSGSGPQTSTSASASVQLDNLFLSMRRMTTLSPSTPPVSQTSDSPTCPSNV